MSRVGRNIGWNAGFVVAQTGASLLVVPLLIGAAGEVAFGTYTFLFGVVALVQLVQGALVVAVARAVAEHGVDRDDRRLAGELTFAYWCSLAVGVLAAGLLLGIAAAPGLVNAEGSDVLVPLCRIFAVSLVVSIPLSIAAGLLAGQQRFAARNGTESIPLLTGAAAAALLATDAVPGGILTYAATVEVTRVCASALATLLAARQGLPRPRPFDRVPWRLVAFQGKQLANQAADVLFYTADRFVLQIVVGAVAVAHYAVADRPQLLAQSILSVPLIALVPAFVAAIRSSDAGFVERARDRGTAQYCLLTMPALLALFAGAPALVELWVGPGYGDAATALRFMVAGLLVAAPFKVYSHYRLAEGSIGAMAAVKLGYAPLNAIASFWLAHRWGLVGVVLPTTAFWVAVYPAGWLVSMHRRGDLAWFVPRALPSLACLPLLGGLGLLLPGAGTGWPLAVAAVAGFTVCCYAAVGVANLPWSGPLWRRAALPVAEPMLPEPLLIHR